jgi:hypothetical protein
MTGAEAARRLRTVASLVAGRDGIPDDELSGLVALSLFGTPFETLAMKRARAGRNGGRRSVEARREANGTAKPNQVPKHPPKQDAKQVPKQNAFASEGASGGTPEACPPPAPPPPDPEEEKDNKNAQVRARDDNRERRPSCLSGALEHGVCSRSELVLTNARDTEWVLAMQPQNWPEVRRAAERFAKGTGRPGDAKLGSYARDAGTRAIVELFAAGHMPSVVEAGLERIASSEWYRSGGASRGLSSITPEVFRREGTEVHAPVMETRPRAPESAPRVDVVPPPPEVTAALDGLAKAQGGRVGVAAAKRARAEVTP